MRRRTSQLWAPSIGAEGSLLSYGHAGTPVLMFPADAGSAGYFVFFCHLKNEATLQGLVPDQPVTTSTPVGVMGDTGNAAGTPQLHAEIHYPAGSSFTCSHCTPNKTLITSIDPEASLIRATRRA